VSGGASGGKASCSVVVPTETDAVILMFKPGGEEGNGSKSVEQCVPLVWTRCHFGGARPWFRCVAYVGGRLCGRRVAKLYLRDAPVFGCRQCCGLAYASQSENPRYRAISRVQNIRMRLGGSADLVKPFPKKPREMHRWTYYRLLARACLELEKQIDQLRAERGDITVYGLMKDRLGSGRFDSLTHGHPNGGNAT
jgi:hypothetical protein